MNQLLSKNADVKWLKGAVAAGATIDDDSAIVDTEGWDGVCFVTPIIDSVATGVATMTAEQNTANSGTGMAALAGAVAQATCAVNDDINGKVLIVDVYRPLERYLRVNRASATANIAYGDVIAILYHGRVGPAPQAGAAAAAAVASPAEA